jgi:hypothetical protein
MYVLKTANPQNKKENRTKIEPDILNENNNINHDINQSLISESIISHENTTEQNILNS